MRKTGGITKENIEKTVLHQLHTYWTNIDDKVVVDAIPDALIAMEENYKGVQDKYTFNGGIFPSPYISVQWMNFLYRLAHKIYVRSGGVTPKEADQVYYLNKVLHSIDWFYQIALPTHFLCEHPLGSVLGKAKYGDYFFVYQGTTVGGNRSDGRLYYPSLGDNVIMYANATVLGNTCIGNNVVISADTYIINEKIPDNCIVFGKSPELVIKQKSEKEIKGYTAHIWNWR